MLKFLGFFFFKFVLRLSKILVGAVQSAAAHIFFSCVFAAFVCVAACFGGSRELFKNKKHETTQQLGSYAYNTQVLQRRDTTTTNLHGRACYLSPSPLAPRAHPGTKRSMKTCPSLISFYPLPSIGQVQACRPAAEPVASQHDDFLRRPPGHAQA